MDAVLITRNVYSFAKLLLYEAIDATLKDRTYEHEAKVISGKPITLGHGYSTLAWIPEEKGSWALPFNKIITA